MLHQDCCCKICLFFLFRFMFYAGAIKILVVCGEILTSSRLPDKAFKISLHFVSYKSSTDHQWNEMQLCTTRSIKEDKKNKK